jgi:WD40 repeat protein
LNVCACSSGILLLLQVAVFAGDRHCVTALACSHDSQFLAAGYHNGVVRVFDVSSGECTVTFSGHRTQVSALNFDAAGMQLVSGGLVSLDYVGCAAFYCICADDSLIEPNQCMLLIFW